MQDLGNAVVAAGRELRFAGDTDGAAMNNTACFQYMLNNIPGSLFTGYAWTLDTFVDYTLRDLASLSSIIIVMMVAEVRSSPTWSPQLVQMARLCCGHHLRLQLQLLMLLSTTACCRLLHVCKLQSCTAVNRISLCMLDSLPFRTMCSACTNCLPLSLHTGAGGAAVLHGVPGLPTAALQHGTHAAVQRVPCTAKRIMATQQMQVRWQAACVYA
jgi:hypothetical protein